MSTPTEGGPTEGEVPPAEPLPEGGPAQPAGDTVITPVTEVTDTETGTVVVGFPPSTSTGYEVAPVVGADDGTDPRGSQS